MGFLLALAALVLSYANGANDNFKGVATLYGAKVLPYRKALIWATCTTFAGSIFSFLFSTKLISLFSGQGLVAPDVVQNSGFLVAVAPAAACTVMLATFFRFPISTTHSLVGALLGSGVASGGLISLTALGKSFFIPLLISPAVAVLITVILYSAFRSFRMRTGVESSYCLCIGERQELVVGAPGLLTIRSSGVRVAVDEEEHCRIIYPGRLLGLNLQKMMDQFHIVSAGAVSFARGLNDTPKIAALLVFAPLLVPKLGPVLIASMMAIGGLIHSHRIARTMSWNVTEMNPGQAFSGNFVTALLVIFGSLLGFPLSTTHVSCGALFGIGIVSGTARKDVILQILFAWVITLPIAAMLAAFFWFALNH